MVTLYDHRGEPVKTGQLKEPQTARMAHLHREFANHPSRGLTPARIARILEAAEQGDLTAQAELAEDMEEKDAHLYAELSKRRRAVLARDWDVLPPKEASAAEKQAAQTVGAILSELDMDSLLLDLAAGILPGYACIEIEWGRDGKTWLPEALHFRPPSWFMTRTDDRDTVRLRTATADGEHLLPWGWIEHRHPAKSGYVARSGLARVLVWPFLFRNYAARDMAEFLEIYGLPLRLGTYPVGAGDDEKATLMRAVVGIGHAAAGIIPEGMRIEFQEAAKGVSSPFSAMIGWAEKSISKAIVGQTLSSDTGDKGGGSYALGRVHEQVMANIVASDLRQYARTLTRQLVTPLTRLNTGAERCPRFVFDLNEPEDLKHYADAVPKLVAVGMRIPESWVREKLRIPEPDGDEPVLAAAAGGYGQADLKARPGRHAAARTAPDEIDEQDRQLVVLEAAAEPAIEDMVAAVRRIVDQAASLTDLRDRLSEAWPDMDASALADAMAKALAAAQLAGRFDILEEL